MARKLRYEQAVPHRVRKIAELHGLTPPNFYVPSAEGVWLVAGQDDPDSGSVSPAGEQPVAGTSPVDGDSSD
jgi:hypothetical protein